jgi:multimeric flavodoxin WrbA
MKKIIGFMGSPRENGNTHVLISKILEGAKSKGAQTELILLKDLDIKDCDGCLFCWKEDNCNKIDDMINLYSKLADLDVLILGSPVYWWGPTAIIKAFIDRFFYFGITKNRNKIKGKKAVLVIPLGDTNLETADLLIKMFEYSFEFLEIPIIEKIIATGVNKKGEVSKMENIMQKCYELGKNLAG